MHATSTSAVNDEAAVELWGRVIRGFTATNRRLHDELKSRYDFSEAEIETLLTLHRMPEHQARHNALAQVMGFTTGGFTKVADKLTQRGLTDRQACVVDRRVSYLRLTESGALAGAEIAQMAAQANREHFIEVLGEERAQLVADAFGALYQANHRATAAK